MYIGLLPHILTSQWIGKRLLKLGQNFKTKIQAEPLEVKVAALQGEGIVFIYILFLSFLYK